MNRHAKKSTQNTNYTTAIRNLQTYLRQLAYFDPRIPLVPIDGIYAEQTRKAVEAFQLIHRLPVSGTVDPPTWDLLYTEYLRSLERHNTPSGLFPFPREPYAYTIRQGEESDLVDILHHMLHTLAQIYDGLRTPPTGNRFSTETERAIRFFQSAHGLPVTGAVDVLTWNALAEAYNRVVSDGQ